MNERFTALETSVDPNAPTVPELHSFGKHRVTAGLVLGGHHPMTLCGLSQVLGREQGFTVLAVATTHEAILEEVRRHRPRVVILDLDQNATFKLLRRLQRHGASIRIVVLTSASEYNEMADALLMGAHAVVKKEVSADAVVACIRRVSDSMQRPRRRNRAPVRRWLSQTRHDAATCRAAGDARETEVVRPPPRPALVS